MSLKTLISLFAILLLPLSAIAQRDAEVDVVTLKNGSVIRGKIIENILDVSLKIRTTDGSSTILVDYKDLKEWKTELAMSTNTPEVAMSTRAPEDSLRKSFIGVNVAYMMPMGDYSTVDGLAQFETQVPNHVRLAGNGYAFAADGLIAVSKRSDFAIGFSINQVLNRIKIQNTVLLRTRTAPSVDYEFRNLMIGVGFNRQLQRNGGVLFHARAMAGLSVFTTTEELLIETDRYDLSPRTGLSYSFDMGFRVRLGTLFFIGINGGIIGSNINDVQASKNDVISPRKLKLEALNGLVGLSAGFML